MADGYDPRMLQMARMGINMMGPQAGFAPCPGRWTQHKFSRRAGTGTEAS